MKNMIRPGKRPQESTLLRRLLLAAALMLCMLQISACRGMELENKTEDIAGYTRAQAMIVLATERNRYQNFYTSEIWDARFGDVDESFDVYMVQNVKSYLEQIKTLGLLAKERGISVTSQERDSLRALSAQYYEGLSEADRAYIGCSESDVQTVYEELLLADKTAAALVEGKTSELSDSEAKIIHVQQIVTASLKKAKALLKMVKIDGDDFALMAARYSEVDEVDRVLSRSGEENLYEKTAFSLDEGQISNIVEMDGMYYIIKCTNGYDKEATLARKDRIEAALSDRAFLSVYEPYRSAHPVKFSERFWNGIDLREGMECTTTNFFALYREAFPELKIQS